MSYQEIYLGYFSPIFLFASKSSSRLFSPPPSPGLKRTKESPSVSAAKEKLRVVTEEV